MVERMKLWKSHECCRSSKYIQSTDDTSGTANMMHICHRDDKIKMPNVRTGRSLWNSSWFLSQAVLLVLSIMFGIIFLFPRFRAPPFRFQHCFRTSFSGLVACIYSDTISNGTTLSTPITASFSSNGRTDMVQWDKYTLALHGQRVLV